jgi:hypothetical protein
MYIDMVTLIDTGHFNNVYILFYPLHMCILCSSQGLCCLHLHLHLSHLADALIQSDLFNYWCAYTILYYVFFRYITYSVHTVYTSHHTHTYTAREKMKRPLQNDPILWFYYLSVCVWVKITILFSSINYWQHFSLIPSQNIII